jgi:Fe-S-cluster containining protein
LDEKQITTEVGYNFAFRDGFCGECGGKCCVGESGYIWISEEEAQKVASFLLMDIYGFADRYLFRANGKLSIKEKEHGGGSACVFFDEKEKNCSIYDVRPTQCRTFPFWDYYKTHNEEALKECPALIML